MSKLFLLTAFAALTACERYTDKSSPCFGRNGKPVVTRNSAPAALPFAPSVGRNAIDQDCEFRPLGTGV